MAEWKPIERARAILEAWKEEWSFEDREDADKEWRERVDESLIRRIAAALAPWQPIESAPVNQSVLIYIPNAEHYGEGIYRGLLVESDWVTNPDGTHPRHWQTNGLHVGRDCLSQLPTRWMPLPPAPDSESDR